MKALLLALVLGVAVDGGSLVLKNGESVCFPTNGKPCTAGLIMGGGEFIIGPGEFTIGPMVGFVFGSGERTLATIHLDGGCSVTWSDGGTGQEKSALCDNAAAALQYANGF